MLYMYIYRSVKNERVAVCVKNVRVVVCVKNVRVVMWAKNVRVATVEFTVMRKGRKGRKGVWGLTEHSGHHAETDQGYDRVDNMPLDRGTVRGIETTGRSFLQSQLAGSFHLVHV